MIRILFICCCLLYSMPSCVKKATAQTPGVTAIPVLKVLVDTSMVPLQMAKLHVEIKIAGNIATTIFDITYYNDRDEVLDGEFDFPLADGQSICRYALDINGVLREGVVVEKAKARVAYESTVRQNIDPGLVEKTRGNNFRTRIYPIPAKGYKRVLIGVEQTLLSEKNALLYRLPLVSEQTISEFKITATAFGSEAGPTLRNNTFNGFGFSKNSIGWNAAYQATILALNHLVEILLPQSNDGQFYTGQFEGRSYFYAHIPFEPEYRDKKRPASLLLLWDVSASAEKRDREKELRLLSSYLEKTKQVSVKLVPFNISTLTAEHFTIRNGNSEDLIKRLRSFNRDGGTQLGAINLRQVAEEEILLFSDGLSTFGKKEIILAEKPVIAISSSASADNAYLRYVALQTHGRFINLAESQPEQAFNEMSKEPLQFIGATYNNTEIDEFYGQVNSSLQNGFSFAGMLKSAKATVTLNFGYGNYIITRKTMLISQGSSAADNIRRIWASKKIAWLELEYQKNKDAITSLGKQFSIVTQNTSLLVLDRVEDYLEHEIVPPAELQKEYYVLLKEKLKQKEDSKAAAMEQAATAMNDMKEWYTRKNLPVSKKREVIASPMYDSLGVVSYENVTYTLTDSARIGTAATLHFSTTTGGDAVMAAPPAAAAELNQVRYTPPVVVADAEVSAEEPISNGRTILGKIQLNEWKADAPYLKELDKAGTKYYERYLSLKAQYNNQPSFFVDVARYFFQKNDRQLALQVLSNVTELKLEDPELLRVVANQLIEFGEKELAAELFKELLHMREEEPQAYRDLALACNETGKYQEAVDLLYKVATNEWEDRFSGIRSIALNEMNAIISGHRNEVSIAHIDKKFIQPMSMDVRIVIGWSTNDSDIDLWVTDPAKEKCYYQSATTSAGGQMSTDMTGGYGPEEFKLKKAAKGDYLIEANLYGDRRQTLGGPITIQAELFTDFGKPTQTRRVINCRVTTDQEVVKIGTLKFE